MATAIVKDSTDKSMTAGKRIAIPVTILEAPNMKVYSVRFYKHFQVVKEVVVSNDKILKHILKVPAQLKNIDTEMPKDYDDIRVIVYSLPSQTSVKKTPDIVEVAIDVPNKLEFVKGLIGKEIPLKDFLQYELLDIRAVTKAKGLEGPVPRFGLTLKNHKSEKGVRRPGSLAPWHPARVTFRTPQAGQLGMFSRVHYNHKVISHSTISEKNINPKAGFTQYGLIKGNYIIIKGSVQGPQKRQVLLTPAFRPTKRMAKKKYELVEVVTQ